MELFSAISLSTALSCEDRDAFTVSFTVSSRKSATTDSKNHSNKKEDGPPGQSSPYKVIKKNLFGHLCPSAKVPPPLQAPKQPEAVSQRYPGGTSDPQRYIFESSPYRLPSKPHTSPIRFSNDTPPIARNPHPFFSAGANQSQSRPPFTTSATATPVPTDHATTRPHDRLCKNAVDNKNPSHLQ